MKALITGASSGIGRDFAHVLGSMGCELILVARRENRMEELRNELPVPVQIICADLSSERECFALYEQVREEHIDILINNAGFGVFGAFQETDLTEELKLIDTNIRAVHILTKLFLKDFTARDAGYLLNVSSCLCLCSGATDGRLLRFKGVCAAFDARHLEGTAASKQPRFHQRPVPRPGEYGI